MTEPVLKIENLEVDFGGFKAVDGFNMSIKKGEIRVLIGANGAGKTTLMDLITSKTRVTGGRVLFKGRDITNWQEHDIARAGIGRKFQVPSLFKELTLRDNLEVASSEQVSVWRNVFVRPGKQENGHRINEVLDLVGLREEAENTAGNLSHGQAQWLELGMILMQEPELVLLDEPTAGMTGHETQKTSQIINNLKGSHTIIVVEHDMIFVRSICEKITVMHLGKNLAEGNVAEIENNPLVVEAYLGSSGIGHA